MFFLYSGTLTSRNFPSFYPNYHSSTQTMQVTDGQRILIRFTDFDVEGHSSCGYDSVMVQDYDGTILLEKTCYSRQLPDILSKTNRANVIFRTDSSVVRRGWSLKYGSMPECIVLDTDRWSWLPGLRPLRNPRSHASVISSALGVYIIGGTSSPYTSEFLPWTTAAGATGIVEGATSEVKLVGGSGPHEGNILVGGLPV